MALHPWLQPKEAANVATVISAVFTTATVVLAFLALQSTNRVNRAEHRDKTFANVVQAAKATIGNPSLAPQLILSLHAAARNIEDGLLTPEDTELLSKYLDSEGSLKGRPELCESWRSIENTSIPSDALKDLVQRAFQCAAKAP